MGEYKDTGCHALALAEECAEVIQVISKLYRFAGDWDEIPPGKEISRWDMLEAEMADVLHHWEELRAQRRFEQTVLPDILQAYKDLGLSDEGPDFDSAGFSESDR